MRQKLRLNEGQARFAKEVGSIVLGVLIALGLGAIATELGWRREVAQGREQLRHEIAFNMALIDRAVQESPCVSRRLDQLGLLLNEASRSRRLPPLGLISRAPSATWPRGIWNSQIAAETTAHYPSHELAALSRVYGRIDFHQEADGRVSEAWATLSMMVGPGRPLDAATEGALYAALGHARLANSNIPVVASRTKDIVADSLGAGYPKLDAVNAPAFAVDQPICGPIGTEVPLSYGVFPEP